MTTILRSFTPDQAGCLVDGSVGWRGPAEVVDLAARLGWTLTEEDKVMLSAFRDGITTFQWNGHTYDPAGFVIDQAGLADTAESWLNQHQAPSGYSFGWHDGEFFLWSDEDWQDAS